jgi:hypothetical protein
MACYRDPLILFVLSYECENWSQPHGRHVIRGLLPGMQVTLQKQTGVQSPQNDTFVPTFIVVGNNSYDARRGIVYSFFKIKGFGTKQKAAALISVAYVLSLPTILIPTYAIPTTKC